MFLRSLRVFFAAATLLALAPFLALADEPSPKAPPEGYAGIWFDTPMLFDAAFGYVALLDGGVAYQGLAYDCDKPGPIPQSLVLARIGRWQERHGEVSVQYSLSWEAPKAVCACDFEDYDRTPCFVELGERTLTELDGRPVPIRYLGKDTSHEEPEFNHERIAIGRDAYHYIPGENGPEDSAPARFFNSYLVSASGLPDQVLTAVSCRKNPEYDPEKRLTNRDQKPLLCDPPTAAPSPPPNPAANRAPADYVGFWQDMPVIAAGYSNYYQLFADGTFYHYNPVGCGDPKDKLPAEIAFDSVGRWSVTPTGLRLEVALEHVGRDPSCECDFDAAREPCFIKLGENMTRAPKTKVIDLPYAGVISEDPEGDPDFGFPALRVGQGYYYKLAEDLGDTPAEYFNKGYLSPTLPAGLVTFFGCRFNPEIPAEKRGYGEGEAVLCGAAEK